MKLFMKTILIRLVLTSGAIFSLVAPFIFESEKPAPTTKTTIEKAPEPEKPLHNVSLPKFSAIKDVNEKKRRFFDFIRPSIEKENAQLLAKREEVKAIQALLMQGDLLMPEQEERLNQLAKRYKIKQSLAPLTQVNLLLRRIDIIPTPLVLVQAANESAWGTSRFARIGLNFFGIWCYSKGCGMVPNSRNTGANHEVKAFKTVDSAVSHYLHNLNTNAAYKTFRMIRRQLREYQQPLQPEVLATGLIPYSERGTDYVVELAAMLRHNKRFFKAPQLAEQALVETASP